ncbi:uncharacterized protein LOC115597806 [Calypte anna]|uniref:uncharacterized protein LOC115597806 n=1 Tax=Calypte anna TaxID=9244 RepID=UPI0011C345E9|nr:uncharacterized protein LOC115597806 [Calypte anna]
MERRRARQQPPPPGGTRPHRTRPPMPRGPAGAAGENGAEPERGGRERTGADLLRFGGGGRGEGLEGRGGERRSGSPGPGGCGGPSGAAKRGRSRLRAAAVGLSAAAGSSGLISIGSAPARRSAATCAGRPAGKLVLADGRGAGTGGGLESPEAKFCDTPTLGTIAVSALQNFVSGGGGGPGRLRVNIAAASGYRGLFRCSQARLALGVNVKLTGARCSPVGGGAGLGGTGSPGTRDAACGNSASAQIPGRRRARMHVATPTHGCGDGTRGRLQRKKAEKTDAASERRLQGGAYQYTVGGLGVSVSDSGTGRSRAEPRK